MEDMEEGQERRTIEWAGFHPGTTHLHHPSTPGQNAPAARRGAAARAMSISTAAAAMGLVERRCGWREVAGSAMASTVLGADL